MLEQLRNDVVDMVALDGSNLEKDVVQLIYCSQASRMAYPPSHHQIVSNIIDCSIDHNLSHGITGTLLTDEKFFAQIVEGSPSEVNQLYRSILHDERHHSVMLLQYVVTNIRLFPRWPMALVEADDLSYVGRLSAQSTPGDLRKARLSILKSLRPVFCGE